MIVEHICLKASDENNKFNMQDCEALTIHFDVLSLSLFTTNTTILISRHQ